MFWGWYSSGGGGYRRGGGCFFLPFLFLCGSFFLFGGSSTRWLLPLLVIGVLLFIIQFVFNRSHSPAQSGNWVGEKPKRDFTDEKPKRDSQLLYRDDGDILEVVDPPHDDRRIDNEHGF